MSWKSVEPVLTRLPTVSRPQKHVPFRQKMLWTAGILVLYFFLTNVAIYGLGTGSQDAFGAFRSILAGSQGSVLQLGIGPIVTASIVLQLLSGSDLLGLDTNDPRDQMIYQGLQKVLVFVMILFTGLPLIFAGGFLQPDAQLAQSLGIGLTGLQTLMFLQIAIGGVLILYMDEVISKWGIGSGVGLFIIAGISQRLIGGIFAWAPLTGDNGLIASWIMLATGAIELGALFGGNGFSTLIFGPGQLLAVFTTFLIFFVVVYAESVRVEIPLSHKSVRGARGRFPVKLIYASVLPMILVRAVQANLQFAGQLLASQTSVPEWFAVYGNNGQVLGGLMWYLAPIRQPSDWMWWAGTTAHAPWEILLRVGIDLTVMVAGGALFAVIWVKTTGMGPDATAKQIQNSGMQIPGFRSNHGVLEKVMERYIPQVTIIGGAIVGLLAVMANMLGTIGGVSGTGLLLTVSITYKLYEEIAEEKLSELYPGLRELL